MIGGIIIVSIILIYIFVIACVPYILHYSCVVELYCFDDIFINYVAISAKNKKQITKNIICTILI